MPLSRGEKGANKRSDASGICLRRASCRFLLLAGDLCKTTVILAQASTSADGTSIQRGCASVSKTQRVV